MASNIDEHPVWLGFKAKVERIRREEGEEKARAFLIDFMKNIDLCQEAGKNEPSEKCDQSGCDFVTYAKDPEDRRTALSAHHCQVRDRMKAGAYAWVAIDESGQLATISYVGFDRNIEQAQSYLKWAENYAIDKMNGTRTFKAKIDRLFERYDQVHLVVFERDSDHPEESGWWGDHSVRGEEGHRGISHRAAGIMIDACLNELSGQIIALNLNSTPGWTDPENRLGAKDRDFAFYKRKIEEIIRKQNA